MEMAIRFVCKHWKDMYTEKKYGELANLSSIFHFNLYLDLNSHSLAKSNYFQFNGCTIKTEARY